MTRARHQAASTVRAFEEAGARAELLPLIEVVPPADAGPLDSALSELQSFSWVLFTSANTVEHVLRRPGVAWGAGDASPKVASVGSSTSEALRERGIAPDLEALEARAEGLADLLGPCLVGGERLLLPQAADARPVLEELLLASGARVVRVDAYAKRMPPSSRARAEEIFGDSDLGWVTFTSPSIARNFVSLFGDSWPARRLGLLAVSIGPVTSVALRKLGVEPAAEAAEPGDAGLVEAVAAAVEAGDAPPS